MVRLLVSQQMWLWHLTAIDNLESILKNGLLARNQISEFVDVADQEIIIKRGILGNYVPFHFFQGNPFDGRILKDHKDKTFCFIVITREIAKDKGYKILPKHPLAQEEPDLYNYDEGMKAINWALINKREYADKECKIACMAECLALKCVSPNDFYSIKVKTKEDKLYVKNLSESLFDNYNYKIEVEPYRFNAGC